MVPARHGCRLDRGWAGAITADADPPRRTRAFGGRRLFQPADSAGRQGRGDDLCVPELCRATREDGSHLSNADIVDHMSFLMVAAHDTLTSFVYRPAANPLWQGRVREEGRGLKLAADELLPFSRLDDLTLTEMAFKEEPDDERPKPQAFVASTSLQARTRGGGRFARSPLAHDRRPRVRFRSAARKGSKQWPAK